MKKTKKPLRKYAEIVGFCVLVYSVWAGRHVLYDSFTEIKNANVLLICAAFFVAWFNFLWSALSYKLLAKNVHLKTILLVHIAASGPGRVIPGGAGHFSFGILYLKRQKYSLEQAVAIATINNVLGFTTNIMFFLPILLFKPNYLPDVSFAPNTIYIGLALCTVLLVARVLYTKNRKLHKGADKTKKEILKKARELVKNPGRFTALIATMAAQVVTHVTVLLLASYALGTGVSPLTAFVAMSSGVALGSLVPTPGGIGGVEAGLITSLLAFGLSSQDATAIALTYRSATYVQPLLPGILCYMYLRKKNLL